MPVHSTVRQSPHGVQTPYRYHRLAFLPEQPAKGESAPSIASLTASAVLLAARAITVNRVFLSTAVMSTAPPKRPMIQSISQSPTRLRWSTMAERSSILTRFFSRPR